MLDILKDSTAPMHHCKQIKEFGQGGNSRDVLKLFLVSTHAGDLGTNLTAADPSFFTIKTGTCGWISKLRIKHIVLVK
ncbi:hypothetical protein BD769DRAFT_1675396 [Suillus cothurnatus]|nr:hypothetical protein BD769DRAFT_1675396 [Suillus cothurnatus]